MFTRKDYLDHKCSHEEYYAQFVTPGIVGAVERVIGRDAILASQDPHFNDIPLARWDRLSEALKPTIPNEYGDGKRYYGLAGGVCILKEAARQIKAKG